MTDFNYKKYSLENLENWLHDAMSAGDATPQEIYDVILDVVKDNYYTYKEQTSKAHELLALLNGNSHSYEDVMKEREYYEQPNMTEEELSQYKFSFSCDKDNPSPECKSAWNSFWEDAPVPLYVNKDGDFLVPDTVTKVDQVNRWVLPVDVDGLTGDCLINLPDDLLERAGLKEGDMVHWIDRGDGSFELRKVTKPLGMDEC